MRVRSNSFWKGFAVGAVLLGALGAFALNLQITIAYVLRALALTQYEAVTAVLLDHGEINKVKTRLRRSAYWVNQDARFARCMSEYRYHLWMSGAYEGCYPILEEQMPEDWEIPGKQRYTVNEDGHVVARDVSTPDP